MVTVEKIYQTAEGRFVQIVDPNVGRLIVPYQTMFTRFTGWVTALK